MNNRWKAAILLAILCFYITLSVIESIEYSKSETNHATTTTPSTDTNTTQTNKTTTDDVITIGNQTMNISTYFKLPQVEALKGLYGTFYEGGWEIESTTSSGIFNDFNNRKGYIKLGLVENINNLSEWRTYRVAKNLTLKVVVFDGQYSDDRIFAFLLNDLVYNAFNTSSLTYNIPEKNISVINGILFEDEEDKECKVGVTLNLTNVIKKMDSGNAFHSDYRFDSKGSIELTLTPSDCGFKLSATVSDKLEDTDRKTINYSIILTFLAIINLYGVAKMIKQCIDSPSKASQLSILTIGFILIWDTYICFGHLYLALKYETLFHFFIMPTFWYFILFSIFEMKLLIIAWRARYWNALQDQEQARRAMANFYLKLYVGMIVILLMFYNFALENWFLLIMSLYLVPQIIHNAMRGGRIEFDYNYMFLVIGLRVFLPLYFRGCPENILRFKPSMSFCFNLVMIFLAQIFIIYYQSIHGSKFFIPARFLPAQYNYLEDLPEDIETGIEFDDCAVCMNPIHQNPDISTSNNPHTQHVLSRLRPTHNQIMKTPCNHKFHVSCLVEWMNIKMECPTCRAALPVLE